ncbi:MAG TPA: hypothetical protein VL486_16010 [Verrucomicrobiae bacterium]|nr:hypothetical protein [Verrucomicrobiae bacterium]
MKITRKQAVLLSWLRDGCVGIMLAAIAVGCAGQRALAPARSPAATEPVRAAPPPSQFGPAPAKVVLVNPGYQFVVIDFSSRVMPPVGTRLNVYRGDKNVGAVRITEPMRARLATADILQGDVRVGDDAR